VDWSLLGCGHAGHVTYAPEEPELREQLSTDTASGEAWRCLRCAAFVIGDAQRTGPAAQAPAIRRGTEIRSALILRIFAVERFARTLIFGAAAYVVWRFRSAQETIEQAFRRELPIVRALFRQLGYNVDHSKLVGLIQHALTLSRTSISVLAGLLAAYAAVELIEGIGLWLARRWGEYFAMVVTSLGLPYEVYDMASKITVTRVILFAINLALVLYLVITKRLLGVRGGRRAYEARLRSESVMEAAVNAAAAARENDPHRAAADPAEPDPAEPGPVTGSPPGEQPDLATAPHDTAAVTSQGARTTGQAAPTP
jgi:uncharacterized membrane protein (DUF2068 family)